MTAANVLEIKNHFSRYLDLVVRGEPIQVCRHNVAVAQIIPVQVRKPNGTQLGCGRGTVQTKTGLTEPVMDLHEWQMKQLKRGKSLCK